MIATTHETSSRLRLLTRLGFWGSVIGGLLFRWAIMLLLLTAAVCFAFYAGTGQQRYKRFGLVTLKWTLIAAFCFFAVLVLERIA